MQKPKSKIAGLHLWQVEVKPDPDMKYWVTTKTHNVGELATKIAVAVPTHNESGCQQYVDTITYRGTLDG